MCCRTLSQLAVTFLLTLIVFAGIHRLLIPTPQLNDDGELIAPCPGRSRFRIHGSYIEQIYVDQSDEENEPFQHCMALPQRVYHQFHQCGDPVTKAVCTGQYILENCYPPNRCPPDYILVSASVNVVRFKSGLHFNSNGVCCR